MGSKNQSGDKTQTWTLPLNNVSLIRRELEEENIGLHALLKGTGISPMAFENEDSLLTYDQVISLYDNALELSPRPGLGLRVASHESPTDWGVLGFAMLCCNTVGEVIETILKFHKTAGSMTEVSFIKNNKQAKLECRQPQALHHILPHVMEHQFGAVQVALKKLTGRSVPTVRLDLSYSNPGYEDMYLDMFGCQVNFDQPQNQLIFDATYLDTPIVQSSTIGAKLAQKLCAEQLQRQAVEPDITHQVRYFLLMQGRNFPNAEFVAELLHMTSRTLRYKLREYGTSFQEIRDDVRQQLAISYLESSNLSIEDTAYLVGFDDLSNFRRAFKKWTGKRPSEYRNCPRVL